MAAITVKFTFSNPVWNCQERFNIPFTAILILEKHSSSKDYRECRACGKYCYGFTYCDKEYNLHLDVTCAFLQPSIKHEGHEHALTLFQNLHFIPKCAACCSFASADASFLRCMECNFNVHLTCLLPPAIKHKIHPHTLTLMDSFIEDDFPVHLHCDVCKKERDHLQCICYWAACHFMVEVNCIISEVCMLLANFVNLLQILN